MVSTRKTATLEDLIIEVPKTKKRKVGKSPKAKRPAGEKAGPKGVDTGADEDGVPHSVRQKDATHEHSHSVPRSHSKAYTMRSMDSQMIIDELKNALNQKTKELEEIRRQKNGSHHTEDEAESFVKDDRVATGGGYGGVHRGGRGDRFGPQWNTYKNFMDCKPPSFKGGEDPLECMRWLRKMEQVFESGNFEENQKVVFASRVLEGGAADWWDITSRSMTDERRAALTWVDFADKVSARYCTESAVQKASRDFLDLKMGAMSVGKFNNLFLEKLQFARRYCPDEKSLVARYVEAIQPEYRATVRSKPTLEAAMEEARVLEGDLKEKGVVVVSDKDKRKIDSSSGSSKKKKVDHSEATTSEKPWCASCSNRHRGQCTKETKRCRNCNKTGHTYASCENPPICYNCKETGHISRDCPKEKRGLSCNNCGEAGHMIRDCPKNKDGKKADATKVKGRAYMMTAEETDADNDGNVDV